MLTLRSASAESKLDSHTVRYMKQLDQKSAQVVDLAAGLPMPPPLRSELQQTWRITRQKLAYFRRELERAEGEIREELEVLHGALLPEVIEYQVKVGEMMIQDTCPDGNYLTQWQQLWENFAGPQTDGGAAS